MLSRFSIILESIYASWFFRCASHGNVAYFQKLGSGEEHHVHGIVKKRIAEAALINHKRAQSSALSFNGARQASWAGADTDHIIVCAHEISLPRRRLEMQTGPVGRLQEPIATPR